MAGLRFTDLQSRPTEFLDFTSVTLDEFQQLVPPFEAAFQAHIVTCQIGWFLAKVRDSRWLKQNCHERVRVANSKILFNQWRNEHPSRYRLGHNLTFTNSGQEPAILASKKPRSNADPVCAIMSDLIRDG